MAFLPETAAILRAWQDAVASGDRTFLAGFAQRVDAVLRERRRRQAIDAPTPQTLRFRPIPPIVNVTHIYPKLRVPESACHDEQVEAV